MFRPFLLNIIVFLLSATLLACGGSSDSGGGNNTGGGNNNGNNNQPVRESNLSCLPPVGTVQPGAIGLVPQFPDLPSVNRTVAMIQPQNDSSFWFLIGLEGQVWHFPNETNTNALTTVLDISAQVTTVGEYGLTGAAFHPNFPADNRLFVLYNHEGNDNRSTLSVFTVDTVSLDVDEQSETVLLTLDQRATNHNGGDLAFGLDGFLYISFGDDDRGAEAQDLTNLWGTLLRIDINTSPYAIPADNPLNTGQALCDSSANSSGQQCPEIFAYGFRNPWRFSIDQQTGIPWLGDVGENSFEEVNRVEAGANYGWPIMEGAECSASSPNCNELLYSDPVTTYPNTGGAAIVGGYVYRGSQSPSLQGQYFFMDAFSGRYSSVAANSSEGVDADSRFTGASSFGLAQDNNGEVYVLSAFPSSGEMIYRITDNSTSTFTMPERLSDTGCFDPVNKIRAQGVFEYDNINPLWSDGAEKLRAFAIPDNTQISVLADGEFRFPDNAILIKHFLAGDRYIETRLFVRHPNGWQGYSYEWNDAETEANLLSAGKTKDVGSFVHTYPSQDQCGLCHIGNDASLGLEALQLNRQNTSANANYLDYLNDAGYFIQDISSSDYSSLVALNDTSASLEARAKSYLHSNCSGCHRPGTGNRVDLDFRYTIALSDSNSCNVTPALGDLGLSGAQIIAPGNADASVLLLRMEALDTNRMPPLASLRVDTDATTVIREWINSLSSCN